MNQATKLEERHFTDKEINDVSEWLNDLTFQQLLYLKKTYEDYLKYQASECGHEYEH